MDRSMAYAIRPMPPKTAPHSQQSMISSCAMEGSRPLVLLLEDDAASAEALGFVLSDWGAEIRYAANADTLSNFVSDIAGDVQFIIADYNLGCGPDGVSLAIEVASDSPGSRVLVLSGSLKGEARRAAERAGFDMMSKPARAEDIVAWLERT